MVRRLRLMKKYVSLLHEASPCKTNCCVAKRILRATAAKKNIRASADVAEDVAELSSLPLLCVASPADLQSG